MSQEERSQPMNMTKFKKYLPMIVGILIAIPLAIGAFFLTQGALTRAGSVSPVDILVTKITDSSATITWTTDKESTGVVEYGTLPSQLVFFAPEATAKSQHSVELTLLQSKTPYYFVIRIGDEVYNKDGLPYTFTTKGSSDLPPAAGGAGNTAPKAEPTSVPVTPKTKLVISSCPVTDDCALIQSKLGKGGCSTSDYWMCLRKKSGSGAQATTAPEPTTGAGTPSPTFVPAQLKSPTPTP
jgi:hypothetical protein